MSEVMRSEIVKQFGPYRYQLLRQGRGICYDWLDEIPAGIECKDGGGNILVTDGGLSPWGGILCTGKEGWQSDHFPDQLEFIGMPL